MSSANHPIKWAWIGIGAFILIVGSVLIFTSFIRFGLFSRGYYGMPMMSGGGWLFGILGFLLLCFLGFIAVRFVFWGSMIHRSAYRLGGDNAEEILRQRYARGDINKEQFDQMLRDLREAKN